MSWGDYPEPEWTAETMNRKNGDTTFEMCGWCEYSSNGRDGFNLLLA
jgi:hypothetical protein